MNLLDTDHITHLKYPDSDPGRRLIARMNAAPASEVFGVAIVTVEERMRGWLAVIAREIGAPSSRGLSRVGTTVRVLSGIRDSPIRRGSRPKIRRPAEEETPHD
jgi:hypothetical protein